MEQDTLLCSALFQRIAITTRSFRFPAGGRGGRARPLPPGAPHHAIAEIYDEDAQARAPIQQQRTLVALHREVVNGAWGLASLILAEPRWSGLLPLDLATGATLVL